MSLFCVQIIDLVSLQRKLLMHVLGSMAIINWSLVRLVTIWKKQITKKKTGHQLNLLVVTSKLSDRTQNSQLKLETTGVIYIKKEPTPKPVRAHIPVCVGKEWLKGDYLVTAGRTQQATSLFIDNSLPGRGEHVSTSRFNCQLTQKIIWTQKM